MGYRDLVQVEYSISLDTSNLEERLAKLEGGQDIDALVEAAVKDAGLPTEDRVQELLAAKVEDYVEDEFAQRDLVNEGQMNEAIDDKIESYLQNNSYPDESRVEDMFTEHDFSSEIESAVSTEIDNR